MVQSAILTQWFKGKELALTFGISLAFSRGGSVLNNYLSRLAKRLTLTASFFLGTVLLGSYTSHRSGLLGWTSAPRGESYAGGRAALRAR